MLKAEFKHNLYSTTINSFPASQYLDCTVHSGVHNSRSQSRVCECPISINRKVVIFLGLLMTFLIVLQPRLRCLSAIIEMLDTPQVDFVAALAPEVSLQFLLTPSLGRTRILVRG